ncbi:MAG: peptide-methionine (S)-S-oxide reductase MsrA [Spongiibacteraceae bacterium]
MNISDLLSAKSKSQILSPEDALPGRLQAMPVADRHFVNGHSLVAPFPEGMRQVIFGMGCFWGAERKFWQLEGVYTTAVGYAAGYTLNPEYGEVCSGRTGHNEVVLVVYDPAVISLQQLLVVFWEGHNPVQGMRQGNDIGTQYRSGIYCFDEAELELAEQSRQNYQRELSAAGLPEITTEILPAPTFYYAEEYHQQYLAKNPGGYCGLVPIEQTDRPRYSC